MQDPQTFYVCATNARKKGFDEHSVHRAIAFPSQCCYSCYRAMLLRDRLMVLFAMIGLIAVAATLLLLTYADQWLTPSRVRIAVVAIAVLVLSSRFGRNVGDEKTQAKAIRLARNLDRQGNPSIFPKAKRPTARHFVIIDSDCDST